MLNDYVVKQFEIKRLNLLLRNNYFDFSDRYQTLCELIGAISVPFGWWHSWAQLIKKVTSIDR